MRCIKIKTGNSAEYITTAHAQDKNYPITQPINKHDAYSVLILPKFGLVVTNQVLELHSFKYLCYYYYYCY